MCLSVGWRWCVPSLTALVPLSLCDAAFPPKRPVRYPAPAVGSLTPRHQQLTRFVASATLLCCALSLPCSLPSSPAHPIISQPQATASPRRLSPPPLGRGCSGLPHPPPQPSSTRCSTPRGWPTTTLATGGEAVPVRGQPSQCRLLRRRRGRNNLGRAGVAPDPGVWPSCAVLADQLALGVGRRALSSHKRAGRCRITSLQERRGEGEVSLERKRWGERRLPRFPAQHGHSRPVHVTAGRESRVPGACGDRDGCRHRHVWLGWS